MSKVFTSILIKEVIDKAVKKNRKNVVKKSIKSFPTAIKKKVKVEKPMWQKEKGERLKRESWIN